MESLVPTVALATALYGSGAEPAEAPMDNQARIEALLAAYQTDPMPAEYEQVIRDTFSKDSAFLRSQGVPLHTELQILKGNEVTKCEGIAMAHPAWAKDPDEAEYCPGSNNVMLSEGFVYSLSDHYKKSVNITTAVLRFVVSHELGHAVQETNGELQSENAETLAHHAEIEVMADCLGGTALEHTFPGEVSMASTAFEDFSVDDKEHGLPVQRYESFEHGVAGGQCSLGLPYGPFSTPLAPRVLLQSTALAMPK